VACLGADPSPCLASSLMTYTRVFTEKQNTAGSAIHISWSNVM